MIINLPMAKSGERGRLKVKGKRLKVQGAGKGSVNAKGV